jgi:hypothetical protein
MNLKIEKENVKKYVEKFLSRLFAQKVKFRNK